MLQQSKNNLWTTGIPDRNYDIIHQQNSQNFHEIPKILKIYYTVLLLYFSVSISKGFFFIFSVYSIPSHDGTILRLRPSIQTICSKSLHFLKSWTRFVKLSPACLKEMKAPKKWNRTVGIIYLSACISQLRSDAIHVIISRL